MSWPNLLTSMFQVSDKDFSITLDAYFNVKWQDPRLISTLFNNVTDRRKSRSGDKFSMTAVNVNILPKLWIPDLEIMDLMSFETHKILSRLEGMIDSCMKWFYYWKLSYLLFKTYKTFLNIYLQSGWLLRH